MPLIDELKKVGMLDESQVDSRLDEVKRDISAAIFDSHGLSTADLVLVSPGSIPITTSGQIRRQQSAELYRDGSFARLDAWASHPYPMGPMTEGPWQQAFQVDRIDDAAHLQPTEPPPGIHNRGINGYEWELFKLSTYGVGPLPVMITETGWRHAESTDPDASDGGPSLPDAATVAIYLDLALRGNGGRYPELPEEGWTPWLADPRVEAVTPFALDGQPAEWGHTNWLALDPEGNVLYTYPPFEALAGGH